MIGDIGWEQLEIQKGKSKGDQHSFATYVEHGTPSESSGSAAHARFSNKAYTAFCMCVGFTFSILLKRNFIAHTKMVLDLANKELYLAAQGTSFLFS